MKLLMALVWLMNLVEAKMARHINTKTPHLRTFKSSYKISFIR